MAILYTQFYEIKCQIKLNLYLYIPNNGYMGIKLFLHSKMGLLIIKVYQF
jgi:hypothetical protein